MKHYAVFSEAIRDGAKLRPQAYDALFDRDSMPEVKSCAIGAGYEAMFQNTWGPEDTCYNLVRDAYPYLVETFALCPIAMCGESLSADGVEDADLEDIVAHLNDDHEWTREQIADWLSDEEEKLGFVLVVEQEPELVTV